MNEEEAYRRYQELRGYVGWEAQAAQRIASVGPLLEPVLPGLVEEFYAEIDRHPDARKVITGGPSQVERLKGTLLGWLGELFGGCYERDYVTRRWRVGWRHVEVGLEQIYTNAALSRLRTGLVRALHERWQGDPRELQPLVRSLNQLLDLDLAIIEYAYQVEFALRLQRSERFATIGQVASGVAHELRNPLNVVKTSVYYLLNARNLTPEKGAEHLARIERQVTLADDVITALSSFAKQSMPNFAPCPLEHILREALDAAALPETYPVTFDLANDLPPVLADAAQIRIVFANLLRNARDALAGNTTPPGVPASPAITVAARLTGEHIEVDVRDRGIGIGREHLAQIMEPLYSTKTRGLGLGLAIARSILEKNKGALRVASEPGHGSTFTVTLRTAPGPSEDREP